ncbi:MAG: 2-oxo acid dehydrogenase subunit E2 [Rhodocyclaceae bacterium]|nr:2-oxo acid dehydrogenase subunit E2 [Rhodocyclaceae bacterium]
MIDFRLPSLGADMDAGTLLEWKIKPGDTVKRGDIIAIVDTAKAAVEVEIWQDGTVFELLAEPGTRLAVGELMATLLEPGEQPGAQPGAQPSSAARPASRVPPTTPVPPAADGAVKPGAPPVSTGMQAPGPRKAASPAARRRAREYQVDIEQLTGTGPHGAVTIDDVERAAARAKSTREIGKEAGDRQLAMRQAIASAMARSKREIPHYYLFETISMRRAVDWLAEENARRPITTRLLLSALQLRAVALALRQFPDLNGFWQGGAFVPAAGIHIGVAIALRQGGLIAPALRDADKKGLDELMQALADLVKRTRAGSLKSSEMSDPSVTVTNLGDQGVEAVFGVIYPPQVALIGFGRVVERPWADQGALRAAPVVTASLAADHRASDGHRGARFLAALRELLQKPEDL